MTTQPQTADAVADRPDDQLDALLTDIAEDFSTSPRSPILHTPAEHGLSFQDVTFPSEDGTPLEGWFVPAEGADTVVVINHPRWFSRSGLPAHLEPWRSKWAGTGNDVEVNFVPDIAILHAAGYHVLAYDLRNFGHSGAANGGLTSGGIFESRDVIGSLRYVRSRPDLNDAKIALFSRCLGANATLFAMERAPQAFEHVRCLVACQPLSARVVLEQGAKRNGLPVECVDEIGRRIRLRTSFHLDAMSPVAAARSVRTPTLVYQVHDDPMTRPTDVQAVFDAIPGQDGRDKELFWITGTTRRWDGYLHFQNNPTRVLDWLARHTR
ncbi:alpha/beta hydrolase family protein [Goodfellowiella coeruleoviolacea]|uniref:Alpha/beta hydrolase family protein n=1 Tax=Goodfellowiella coeruleoviolacea TaxID=334858 RepID=A0AAE3KPR7_9PSEU|nr:lysophospholipase [Goodfellowiella coeruleoviolacea]MCP2170168.1 Alpha/beta hydrolase family protein [Goodfellowiella coeruleoviolacea]